MKFNFINKKMCFFKNKAKTKMLQILLIIYLNNKCVHYAFTRLRRLPT